MRVPLFLFLQGEASVIIEANAFTSDGSITYYARQTDIVEHNSPCSHSSITYQYTSAPAISRVSVIDGSYSTGDTLTVSVEFGRQVTVGTNDGVPQLTLIIGSSTKSAIYQSGTGSHIINFTYNIESGDMDNNGINVVSPINMNGGSIKGASSLNALLTFPSSQNFERVFVNFKEKIFSTSRSFALLRHGGSVVTWGWNSYGGDSSPVFSSLTSGVTEIFSTDYAFAALKDDGSVVTWGWNSYGGDSSPVSSSLSSGVTKIFSTTRAFAALKDDGSVVTWGYYYNGGNSILVSSSLSSGVTKIFSTKIMLLPPLKMIDLSLLGDSSSNGGDSHFSFLSKLFQVGLPKSSQLLLLLLPLKKKMDLSLLGDGIVPMVEIQVQFPEFLSSESY